MKLEGLIAQFRTEARDEAAPYLWSDDAVTGWLNEAQHEAAIRARLIHESGNASVCRIAVTAGTAGYVLHASLYEIDHIAFLPAGEASRRALSIVSVEDLDHIMPDWRDRADCPEYAVQTDSSIRLVPNPDKAGEVILEGFRLPLDAMTGDSSEPEINAAHHRHLVNWALHRAFSIPDSEMLDPNRAATAEDAFTDYFGLRPDSDLRRATRQDVPHHNQAFWP